MEQEDFLVGNIREIVKLFSEEKFDQALDKCKEVETLIINSEEKNFLENLKKVILAAIYINQQDLKKALELLESSYVELKKFRPNYKGMKLEGLIDSINQAIIDIKSLGV